MLKGPWDGEKGWGVGCSRILIWEGGASCLGGSSMGREGFQDDQRVFHGKRGV